MDSLGQPSGGTLFLGNYRLETPVARGGMGEIWRATDLRTGQPVAVKRLLLQDSRRLSDSYRARLIREAQAIASLHHENIVRCLGSGFDAEEQPYLVLEWLEGESLAERQRRAPLDLAQSLEVTRQALRGLAACHARGIVHRDIKPGNLFLVGDVGSIEAKVLDFGLALVGEDATRLTFAGEIVGTLAYLSPEQARGDHALDPRVDLYALGVVLYELTTGKLPFWCERPVAILLKIVTEKPPPPRSLRPDLPRWIEEVILRAMERDPARRFADCRAMLDALTPATSSPLPGPTASGAGDGTLLLDSGISNEYRLVSLLCVEPLVGGAVLDSLFTRAVAAAGGRVHRLRGGTGVGLFGLERSRGDEALRAVRAGLAIRDGAKAEARILATTVHLEVGRGLRFDAKELDRAVEVLHSLPIGEVVVDRTTRTLLGSGADFGAVGSFEVVRGTTKHPSSRRRILGVETPTVGRETELATLGAAWRRSVDDQEPEAVLLLGPAGMGKSRLCQDLLAEIATSTSLTLEGRADDAQSRSAYQLFADAVGRKAGVQVGTGDDRARERALAAFVGTYLPEALGAAVTPFIAEAMGVSSSDHPALRLARSDPRLMQEKVRWAFGTLLAGAGQSGPVALVLEDLHWADPESLSLGEHLLAALAGTPLFVLGSARPELLERAPRIFQEAGATRLQLQPLRRRPLTRLLQTLVGHGVSQELEDLLVRWCEGNPFFVEEIASWLVIEKKITPGPSGYRVADPRATFDLPISIESAIQARLDSLDPGLKDLLKAASVLGEVFWESGCEALGFAAVPQQLARLEAAELVASRSSSRILGTREWMFRHSLLHQVAAQMLTEDKQRLLHLRAGRWLEQVGEHDAALLAHHFHQGGDDQRAAHYYAKAGERSLADCDPDRAVEFFQNALQATAGQSLSGERSDRTSGLARAYLNLNQFHSALMCLDQLAQEAGSPDETRRTQVLFLRGRALLGQGRYAEAETTLNEALEHLATQPESDLNFEARHTLFWVLWAQGRYGEASRMGELLFVAARFTGRADHQCLSKLCAAYSHKVTGDLSRAMTLAEEAVGHAREMGHPYREADALTFLGVTEEAVGLYDRARASLESARALAVRLKTIFQQASIEACLGRVALTEGMLDQAVDHYTTAIDRAESLQEHRTLIAALGGKARSLCRRGQGQDLPLARQLASRALDLAEQHAPPSRAEALLTMAEVRLCDQQIDEAVFHALGAVELLDRLGTQESYEMEILLVTHHALRAAGRLSDAAAMLGRAQQALRRRADQISDPAVRTSFIQQVPLNRRAMECSPVEQP
jgi:tetratricopeptide (TPR) repeat protein